MKRIKRDPEKFEVIDLFTAMGREHGYKLNVLGHVDDFISRIGRSIKTSQCNQSLVYGKRVESLFAYVAGALGECRLIKQEDSGEIFSIEDSIQVPDYRLILNDGSQYFIEVKNCHFPNIKSSYSIKKEYLEKLERYAMLHGLPLLFAIYFSCQNKWFLLRKESFLERRSKYMTDFINAMAKNEMALLGDYTIGTEPPLSLELLADRSKEVVVSESYEVGFTIGDLKIYSSDREITDYLEKSIAFYLIRFGDWSESSAEALNSDNGLLGVRFTYFPKLPQEEQNFSFIGALSSMISAAYSEQTIYERSVIALDTKLDPSVFTIKIPTDYKGKALPLWFFIMRSNPAFKG